MTDSATPATPLSDALQSGGHWNPNWDPIAEIDKVWMEKFLTMGLHTKHVLDAKTYEFLAIAVDASVTHMYAPGVRTHIRKALELGATAEEIAAVLAVLAPTPVRRFIYRRLFGYRIAPTALIGRSVIVVDAGIGPSHAPAAAWAPVPGRLPESLAEAGIVLPDDATVRVDRRDPGPERSYEMNNLDLDVLAALEELPPDTRAAISEAHALIRDLRGQMKDLKQMVDDDISINFDSDAVVALADTGKYVSVDGGMSDNARPALYEADYAASLASRNSAAEPALARVVGKHCESGDIVVRADYLPADIASGDLLAVPATGAYCYSLSSNYNMLTRPPVVAVRAGVARLVVRGETEADLFARDVFYQELQQKNRM